MIMDLAVYAVVVVVLVVKLVETDVTFQGIKSVT